MNNLRWMNLPPVFCHELNELSVHLNKGPKPLSIHLKNCFFRLSPLSPTTLLHHWEDACSSEMCILNLLEEWFQIGCTNCLEADLERLIYRELLHLPDWDRTAVIHQLWLEELLNRFSLNSTRDRMKLPYMADQCEQMLKISSEFVRLQVSHDEYLCMKVLLLLSTGTTFQHNKTDKIVQVNRNKIEYK